MKKINHYFSKINFVSIFTFIRIFVALIFSLSIIFLIIYLVSNNSLLAITKLLFGPLETKRSFFNVFVKAIPLMFTGLGLSVCLKSGIFNISSDASFYMGAVIATVIAISFNFPPLIHQFVIIIFAGVIGGIISMLPVIISKYTKINPIVLAIMANSLFYYFGLSIISAFFLENSGSWGSKRFPPSASLGNLIKQTSLHYGILVVIIVAILVIILMNYSALGYKIKLIGNNFNFAKSSGLKVNLIILLAQFIAGCISGVGGAVEMIGVYVRFQWQQPTTYVWDGLLIYMLSNGNSSFVPMTAFLIAYLRMGAEIMSRATNLDPNIVVFFQGIIILLVSSKKFLYFIKEKHEQRLSLMQAEKGGN